MVVYRVEHRDSKNGPWTHNGWHIATANFPYKDFWHGALPSPYGDSMSPPGFQQKNLCGVESLEKLVRWFPSTTRRAMHERGFVLRVFEVKKPAMGRWQVAFSRKKAELLGELPLRGMAGIRNEQFSPRSFRGTI